MASDSTMTAREQRKKKTRGEEGARVFCRPSPLLIAPRRGAEGARCGGAGLTAFTPPRPLIFHARMALT